MIKAPPRLLRRAQLPQDPPPTGAGLLAGDRAPERATVYWIILGILLVGAVVL